MAFSFTTYLPLLNQLGNYFKLAADHYADLKAAGQPANPDIVALFILNKMQGWDPKVTGKSLLDDDTKSAGARFMAGIVVNYLK